MKTEQITTDYPDGSGIEDLSMQGLIALSTMEPARAAIVVDEMGCAESTITDAAIPEGSERAMTANPEIDQNFSPAALSLADPFGRRLGVGASFLARISVWLLWFLIFLLSWAPQALGEESSDVMELSLEELLNVEVTSVSKQAEKRTEAAAAIYVLTQEDIRRSGATNIPEALRLVPGVNVAQIDSNKWSVTARGFAERFANKLLVLIDGRSIYTPFFSGVYWESNDVMLEDVDRIEVIRGPGGTLWGANAVNGVINIVTKRAEDTQGGLLVVGGGSEERGFGALRYGGSLGDKGYYRAYGKFFKRDTGGDFIGVSPAPTTGSPNDEWHMGQGGFRVDLDISDRDQLTIQGDAYRNSSSTTHDLIYFAAPNVRRIDSTTDYTGFNLLTRWNRTLSEASDFQLQLYYDFYHSDDIVIEERRHTVDIDFQHRIEVGARNEVLWGVGYRVTTDDFDNTPTQSLSPSQRTNDVISAYIQDQILLLDTLKLTLGSKFEYNDYSGFEIQPSARIAWTPNERHTLWAAASRAVRTPSRSERDIRLNFFTSTSTPGAFVVVFGDDDFDSEELLAIELGYRIRVTNRLALDFAAFYNDYDNMRFANVGAPFLEPLPVPPHTIVPAVLSNDTAAETYGFEVTANANFKPWWFLEASYSFIEIFVKNPQLGSTVSGDVPEQHLVVQNRFDLPKNVELNTVVRYVDRLSDLGIADYFELDAGLIWHPRDNVEVALVGRNLLDSQHQEFTPTIVFSVPTEVQRSVYGKVTWRF